MAVRGASPDRAGHAATPDQSATGGGRPLRAQDVGELLGRWQRQELAIAKASYKECRGVCREQLEDIYQETTLALLQRPYASVEHLRDALRVGIRHRALNLHRDQRRRREILNDRAPMLLESSQASEPQPAPEASAAVHQDRLLVAEFLAELTSAERRIFWLTAEGLRYRAIAATLQIPVNQARKLARSCERKRQRFQLLYDTGRLCGYRAQTIKSLQGGQVTSIELAQRAFAHLERCASCRHEHQTNAHRLMQAFNKQAAALLGFPLLTGRVRRLARLIPKRALTWHRWACAKIAGAGGARERVVEWIANRATSVKVSAIVLAGVAGGSVAATSTIHATATHSHHDPGVLAAQAPLPSSMLRLAPSAQTGWRARPIQPVDVHRAKHALRAAADAKPQGNPDGFAYLGIPVPAPSRTPRPVVTASPRKGGLFSP